MPAPEIIHQFVKCKSELADRAIDRLVYELYGLTEDEVKMVEGKG